MTHALLATIDACQTMKTAVDVAHKTLSCYVAMRGGTLTEADWLRRRHETLVLLNDAKSQMQKARELC